MTARDWYVVDALTQQYGNRAHVWMFDIQESLSAAGVTHPRAFAQICAALRTSNVRLFNSID